VKVIPFSDDFAPMWDQFVRDSRNGTFLFYRDYMEYHRDRFQDMSLMLMDEDELIAVLPSNRDGNTLLSHGGLTYGGLLTGTHISTPQVLRIFTTLFAYLQDAGIAHFVYRPSPYIYHRFPAQDDHYAFHLSGASWDRSGILSVVDLRHRLPYQKRRERGRKAALKAGLTVRKTNDLAAYWSFLEVVLHEGHNAKPVHTLNEITRLMHRFPDHISLHAAYLHEQMIAGVIVYESDVVARAQYIAAGNVGKENHALDLLFTHLLDEVYAHKWYFDFGTSYNGLNLNVGLIEQKEGFGARAVALDQFRLDLIHWHPNLIEQALQ